MVRIILTLAVLLPMFSGCVDADIAAVSERDLAVLRAVLSQGCDQSDGHYIVVSTRPARMDPNYIRAGHEYAAQLRTAMFKRSQATVVWPLLEVCPDIKMAEEKSIEATFENDNRIPRGWETFKLTYPGAMGVLKVSLPIFTPDGTQAVVVTDYNCEVLCGHGEYFELQEKDGVWRVTHYEGTWIA